MLMERRPLLTQARCEAVIAGTVIDQNGIAVATQLPGERPLTIYLDKMEIVTLMTLGCMPEALILGYLRNQRLVENLRDIASVQVDWDVNAVAVTTVFGDAGQRCEDVLRRRTVTAGCGQGTQFGDQLERLVPLDLPDASASPTLARSSLFALIEQVRGLDTIYKRSGAVHGCVLAECAEGSSKVLHHVEDIGRHNAVDSISGLMWLEHAIGADKVFYTTGRLTSEMVIKVVEMGIPILVSRSGTTEMGLDVARRCGVTLIGRARNERFLVFNGAERIDFNG